VIKTGKWTMLCTFLSLCHILVGLAFPHLAPGQKQKKPKSITTSIAQEQSAAAASQKLKMSANNERTFIMLKPDAVHRGLVGDIIKRFEKKGFKLVAMKMTHASEELLKAHYADLAKKPFFPDLVSYMASGPVVPMVWEGLNVVKTGRVMLGETNPAASAPGTIRGDFCIQVGRNICHGSDAVESAKKEIALWFKEEQLVKWDPVAMEWVYEDFKPTSV